MTARKGLNGAGLAAAVECFMVVANTTRKKFAAPTLSQKRQRTQHVGLDTITL
jgi:hypothetical protein